MPLSTDWINLWITSPPTAISWLPLLHLTLTSYHFLYLPLNKWKTACKKMGPYFFHNLFNLMLIDPGASCYLCSEDWFQNVNRSLFRTVPLPCTKKVLVSVSNNHRISRGLLRLPDNWKRWNHSHIFTSFSSSPEADPIPFKAPELKKTLFWPLPQNRCILQPHEDQHMEFNTFTCGRISHLDSIAGIVRRKRSNVLQERAYQ